MTPTTCPLHGPLMADRCPECAALTMTERTWTWETCPTHGDHIGPGQCPSCAIHALDQHGGKHRASTPPTPGGGCLTRIAAGALTAACTATTVYALAVIAEITAAIR